MAIGNGLCDPVHMLKYGDYLYQIGLIDMNGRAVFHDMENLGMKYIQEKKWNEAFDVSYCHCDCDLLYYQIILCRNMINSGMINCSQKYAYLALPLCSCTFLL
jgi:hypothetical protein